MFLVITFGQLPKLPNSAYTEQIPKELIWAAKVTVIWLISKRIRLFS